LVAKPILLVDDEPALLELLTKYLERLGYQVDACYSAEEALVQFEADPERYALVFTDLTLPGIDGDEMLQRMRARRPKLQAILSSGYPHEAQSKGVVFLQKPYVPKTLAEVIEKLIGL
jgi:two-component system, cell cycle sensor histidine kinase and response regulator CckA